ncbi:MAG TPA: hypothetical protein DCZ91_19400 [Lachnospiraceae bacterium]|nr:hypothetical protein [Lachnospiraceae bacterium]
MRGIVVKEEANMAKYSVRMICMGILMVSLCCCGEKAVESVSLEEEQKVQTAFAQHSFRGGDGQVRG